MRLSPAIEWYRLGSRRPEPVTGMKVMLSSGERWRGLRVDLADVTGPGELAEGTLREHAIVAHIDGPARTDVWYAGKQSSGDCLPGDLCVVPAAMPYAVRRYGPGRLVFTSIGVPLINQVLGHDPVGRVDLEPVFRTRDSLMWSILHALTEEVLVDNPAGPLYAESLGTALVAHLLRRHRAPVDASRRRAGLPSTAVRVLAEYIEAHLAEPISLQDLAELAGLSTYEFARRFRESTGMPPHQYVTRRRIERARTLLVNNDLSILEVALACGFSSQSHFAATFRTLVGVTPRRYRRSQ